MLSNVFSQIQMTFNMTYYFKVQRNANKRNLTYILRFHTDVFTELLHGLWADHIIRAGVLVEPGQTLLTGEEFVSTDCPRTTDRWPGETATVISQ